jgi:hypothetical protein
MDETTNPEVLPTEKPIEPGEEELSHSDKFVGILSSPGETFAKMAKFPPRVIDWLLPVALTVVFAIISNFIIMSNPNIRTALIEKQIQKAEKNFNSMVEKGQLSREQADDQIDKIRDRMEDTGAIGARIIQVMSTTFVVFLSFFIVSLVYFIFAKIALKAEGIYAQAMVANGLPYYVSILSIIVMTILSLMLGRFIAGTSVAAIINYDSQTFLGFILKKLDILTIWALALTGIGLAKMFHSSNTGKYLVTIYSIWIVWGLITFAIAKAVPFLDFLSM